FAVCLEQYAPPGRKLVQSVAGPLGHDSPFQPAPRLCGQVSLPFNRGKMGRIKKKSCQCRTVGSGCVIGAGKVSSSVAREADSTPTPCVQRRAPYSPDVPAARRFSLMELFIMPWTRACSRHSPLPIRRSAHRPFRPVLESLEDRCLPTTFLVTNTGDNGAGSLRQAILDANATAGTDTIAFSIAGAGAHTIQPTSSLPTITDPAVIDATTQPGYAGTPIVEIDGSMAGAGVNGLVITAGSSTIRGLVINRFDVTGINLAGGGGNRIERNYIGTDVTGTLNRGNGGNGIGVFSPNNTIANNLISGNAGIGVLLRGVGTNQNVVAGNYVGTNAVGTAALANG